MFWNRSSKDQEASQQQENEYLKDHYLIEALKNSLAFIEFTPSGEILNANGNFLAAVGYSLSEIKGKHHRIFCDPTYANSHEYKQFWNELGQGQFKSERFKRFTKSGDEMWLEASYNPVKNENNEVLSVVKFATDITANVSRESTNQGLVDAISRSMAVISFEVDGTIIEANDNFLNAVGYRLDEIQGKHHRMFCPSELVNSREYTEFWQALGRGEHKSGMFERRDSQRNVMWLEATYNPIYDADGNLTKVVKFATDITQRVESISKATEAVHATASETEQVSIKAKEVLGSSVDNMDQISADVEVVVNDIAELNTESDKINNIVATISGIAEQTNLLALNAAIEAARAGEQGRGFAVVADEVRSLAAKTTASTGEISAVVQNNAELSVRLSKNISATKEKAQHGVELIGEVDGVFRDINEGMNSIVGAVDEL